MPERATVFNITQIGPETTPGTSVAATKRLIGTSIMPSIKTEVKTYRPQGARVTTTGVMNKEWSEASIEQEVAQYGGDQSYLIAGLLGPPTITNPSSGVYLHAWNPLAFTGLTPKTFTVEAGGFVRASKFTYGLVTGLSMEGSRDGVSLSGSMIGQRTSDGITLTAGTAEVQTASKTDTVSGGTFTISFMGETTSAITYNAANSAVLSALEALPNIAPGDVTLGGGPINTTAVTITFAGQYASADVPLMSINSGSLTGGGTYDIVQTTAGAPLSQLALQPISGKDWDFYLDTTGAGIGVTKLTRVFSWKWGIEDMYGPVWVGNTSEASWAAHVDTAASTSFSFKVEADSTGMGYLTQLRAGTVVFPQIKCTGPTLNASTYLAQYGFAVLLTEISDFQDEDGVYAVEYSGEIVYDATWGKWADIQLRNAVSAIS